MNLADFKVKCLRTEADDHVMQGLRAAQSIRLLHGAIGLATESGELLDQVKKHVFYGRRLDKANILEECADSIWYLVLILDSTGFTLEQAMNTLIPKLEERYAAKIFSAKEAITRNLEAERAILEAHAGGDTLATEVDQGQ